MTDLLARSAAVDQAACQAQSHDVDSSTPLTGGHARLDARGATAAGHPLLGGQAADDIPTRPAAEEPHAEGPAMLASTPAVRAPDPQPWHGLRIASRAQWDAEVYRISLQHQARMADGVIPDEVIERARSIEHTMDLQTRKVIRRVAPWMVAWQKQQVGIGLPTLALLVGEIGHPVWAFPKWWADEATDGHVCIERCGKRHLIEGEPFERNLAKLWAYCGLGDPARRKQTGMSQDDAMALGKTRAKTILIGRMVDPIIKLTGGAPAPLWQVEQQARKTPQQAIDASSTTVGTPAADPSDLGRARTDAHKPSAEVNPSDDASAQPTPIRATRRRSPYRDVYDNARNTYLTTHPEWTDGHCDASAKRIVAKEILRDIYRAALAAEGAS